MAKNTNLKMFIEALFIIAKIWRQPKCPSTDGMNGKIRFGIYIQWNPTYICAYIVVSDTLQPYRL